MKKLIFVGGSKGVGKTSIAERVAEEEGFKYVNTGERVRKYRPRFEELFSKELINTEQDLLIDTHYAANSRKAPYDFYLGLNKDYLENIGKKSPQGKIILVTASPEKILERRLKENDFRRSLDLSQIKKEINTNFNFSQLYSYYLNLPHHVFKNECLDIEEAVTKFREILKNEDRRHLR